MTALESLQHAHVEVLVVGGGPAGLRAAQASAAAGARTLLIERQPTIGEPVHTSGATALETMHEFGIPASLYHPITRLRLCSPRAEAIFDSSEPFACVIDVKGTYRQLAKQAEAAGAVIVTGVEAAAPVVENDRVVGCCLRGGDESRKIGCRVLVDASGYRAALSKAVGLHGGFTRFGVGAELEIVSSKVRQDELLLVVGNRYAPSGYAWVFPWGDDRVRVGVGLLHDDTRSDARKLLDLFVDEIRRFDVDLGTFEVTESHFGLIPANGLASRMAGHGIVAVGDAAGVATLVVGEGIRLSLVSGQLAGDTAARAVCAGAGRGAALTDYERRFRAAYGLDLKIGQIVNRRMARWSDETWDERVRTLKGLPASVLLKFLTSHLSARELASWLATRPRLWPRMLRWFAKGAFDLLLLTARGR